MPQNSVAPTEKYITIPVGMGREEGSMSPDPSLKFLPRHSTQAKAPRGLCHLLQDLDEHSRYIRYMSGK